MTDGEDIVFEETIHVPAADGERFPVEVRKEAVVERVGRYHVAGELDDGMSDEYVPAALDRPIWGTKMPQLVVDVEGDIGRFWVGGASGKP